MGYFVLACVGLGVQQILRVGRVPVCIVFVDCCFVEVPKVLRIVVGLAGSTFFWCAFLLDGLDFGGLPFFEWVVLPRVDVLSLVVLMPQMGSISITSPSQASPTPM